MKNYKIKVNDEAESKEAQELLFQLGYEWYGCGAIYNRIGNYTFITAYPDEMTLRMGWGGDTKEELTLPQLRDLVAKSKSKVREYLDPNNNYKLCLINPSDAAHWMIEVPEGTEVVRRNLQGSLNFYKKIDGHWALKNKVDMDNWYQPKPYSSHFDADDGSLPVVWKREAIQSEPEQGLISGADVPRLIKEGQFVQYRTLPLSSINAHVWSDVSLEEHEEEFTLGDFINSRFEWRLKPRTIKLEIEIPAPFEPKEDDQYWYLDSNDPQGYNTDIRNNESFFSLFQKTAFYQIGVWRTEEEIKQVVEALRGIKG